MVTLVLHVIVRTAKIVSVLPDRQTHRTTTRCAYAPRVKNDVGMGLFVQGCMPHPYT